MSLVVKVDDVSLFTVGGNYTSAGPAPAMKPDVGSFNVTAIDVPGESITVTPIGGWSPVDGHDIYTTAAVGDRRGFSLEVVSFYIGLEKGLNKLPPGKRAGT